MNTIEALQAMKEGKKVTCKGWKGDYLYLENFKDIDYIIFHDHQDNKESDFEFSSITNDWKIYEEPILDDEEKAYLEAVIKPFKKNIISIVKDKYEYSPYGKKYFGITILYKEYLNTTVLPLFSQKSSMYQGMEAGKFYTLEELGL